MTHANHSRRLPPVGGSLHNLKRRVPALRAMPLNPIGDIATPALTDASTNTLTWESASDWDNAVSETGTVHESVTNTDHNDETAVKKGYQIATPYKSADLIAYWPFHEDSGSTANDFSGNNNDGSIQEATLGATGILGTTGFSFDGSNDYVDTSLTTSPQDITVSCWVKADSFSNSNNRVVTQDYTGANSSWFLFNRENDSLRWGVNDNNNFSEYFVQTSSLSTGVWYHVVGVYELNNRTELYLNGSSVGTDSAGGVWDTRSGENVAIGAATDGNQPFGGTVMDVRVYGTAFTSTEASDLYNVVDGDSTLTTSTKSFNSAKKPDLQNLTYTLDGETIVLEVIGSPDTASEEVVSQSLDGASSYSLTWSDAHADFRVRPKLSTTTKTVTPSINRIELVA